jgi:hypothetical protein
MRDASALRRGASEKGGIAEAGVAGLPHLPFQEARCRFFDHLFAQSVIAARDDRAA